MSEQKPTLVSLFAGAGGFDAGLERAGLQTVLAIDHDADAVTTLTASKDARIPNPQGGTYLEDARIELADLTRATRRQLLEWSNLAPGELDVLAGGPPCQTFSSAGRMAGLDDSRGRLFEDFVRCARALRPKLVLFENVQGLVTARDQDGNIGGVLSLVQESFERAGYAFAWSLVNSADFGAPQRRVRLVGVGSRRHVLPRLPPAGEYARDGGSGSLLKPWIAIREALADLPEPGPDEVVRPKPELDAKLRDVAPGQGIRVGGAVEANRPSGHWGYRQDGFIADWDQPARTVRAASTPDWLRLDDGSHRRLTWQECARLQGFPAEWRFAGTTTSRFRQIGNAVPGQLAYALGCAAIATLEQGEAPRGWKPQSLPWPKSFGRRIRYTTAEERVNGALRKTPRVSQVA